MLQKVLILIVLASPWIAALVWFLPRIPRMADPPPSYFETAEQRLSVR